MHASFFAGQEVCGKTDCVSRRLSGGLLGCTAEVAHGGPLPVSSLRRAPVRLVEDRGTMALAKCCQPHLRDNDVAI
jgi:hypothetical protein